MRAFATGVGFKADIGAPPLTQLSFMGTEPRARSVHIDPFDGAKSARSARHGTQPDVGHRASFVTTPMG